MINKEYITNMLLLEKVEEVKNLILEQNTKPIRKWIDFKSAIKYTGMSSSSLDRNIRIGTLKCSKASGKKRRFKIEWLDCFMEGK